MNPQDLLRELIVSGYQGRISGEEVKVQECWFCGNDRWNLELNAPRGVYHCWACGSSGRLDRLLSMTLGGDFEIPVQLGGGNRGVLLRPADTSFDQKPAEEVESALLYLQRRGLPAHVIRTYGLVVCTQPSHSLFNRILFPIREFWTTLTVGHAGRAYTGRHPKYLFDLDRKVIAGWRHRAPQTPTILVEGFMDGISVHRAGFNAAVLSGVTGERIEEFAASIHTSNPSPLGILLDGDAKKEATRLFWQIKPIHPVVLISLPPGRDPADFTPPAIAALIQAHIS